MRDWVSGFKLKHEEKTEETLGERFMLIFAVGATMGILGVYCALLGGIAFVLVSFGIWLLK